MIEIITKPDVAGMGRMVVEGKFYGIPIVALEKFVQAEAEIERNRVAIAELTEVGRAVVERWDSPTWKDLPHTGEYIARLRAACDKHGKHTAKEST